MGLTKSVHPYCKLAIITMQMMPKISCPQRVASDAAARDEIACVVLIVTASSLPPHHPFAALSSFQIPPGLPVPRKARHSIELPCSPPSRRSILTNQQTAVKRNGVHFTIGVTCEIPPSLIKLAIRELEMSGHYFVRR